MKSNYFRSVMLLILFSFCSCFAASGVNWFSEYTVSHYLNSNNNPAVDINESGGVEEFSHNDFEKISEALSVSKRIEHIILVFGILVQICIVLIFALFFSRKCKDES